MGRFVLADIARHRERTGPAIDQKSADAIGVVWAVVVFGCGPVGLFAMKSAWLMGAGRVIAVDHVPYRLDFARKYAQVETVNFKQVDDNLRSAMRFFGQATGSGEISAANTAQYTAATKTAALAYRGRIRKTAKTAVGSAVWWGMMG